MAVKRDRQQIRDILELITGFDETIAEIASQERVQQDAAAEAMKALSEKALGDILRFAHGVQVLDDFFGRLDAAEHDVRAAGKSLLVAGGERIAPLPCG